MRTVTFKSVLDWLARRMVGSVENVDTATSQAMCDAVNFAVREGWERWMWPELMAVEQRWFRPFWTAGTYAQGKELFHEPTQAYWRVTAGSTSVEPAEGASGWQRIGAEGVPALALYVGLDQPGKTAMGTVEAVYGADPRLHIGQVAPAFDLGPDGLALSPGYAGLSVWVRFRRLPSVFNVNVYVNGSSYTAGTEVYDATLTGNCWRSLAPSYDQPGNEAPTWELIPLPRVLENWTKLKAYAELLRDDGQNDKAGIEEDRAEDQLGDEWLKQKAQSGIVEHYNARVA